MPLAIPPVKPSFSTIGLSRARRVGRGVLLGVVLLGFGGLRRCGVAAAEFCGFYGVAHEHGDGHGTDTPGNGREGTGGVDGIGMDVADEHGTFGVEFFEALGKISEQGGGFGSVCNFVGAHVDDGGAGLDPVGGDIGGFAHGGDDDVGAADDVGKIASLGMADGDGGVGVHEKESHGLADDITAAEDDGVGAGEGNLIAVENLHAAGGSAGDEAGTSADEAAEIHGMETVNIFGGIDGFEYALGVDLFGKRELNEDAVDAVVAIEIVDEFQEIVGGAGGGRSVHPAIEAEVMAGVDFAFDVELGGGIFSDEDGGESGADVLVKVEVDDLGAKFGEDFVADFEAVEDARGHAEIIAWGRILFPTRDPCPVIQCTEDRGGGRRVGTEEKALRRGRRVTEYAESWGVRVTLAMADTFGRTLRSSG